MRVPEQDVIALAQGPSKACFEVFRFQEGRLYDRESFLLSDIGDDKTARAEFLTQYYSMRDRIPPRISLDGPVASMELIARWLSEKAGRKVTLSLPQRGEQKDLLEMCRSTRGGAGGAVHGPHRQGGRCARRAEPSAWPAEAAGIYRGL